MTAPDGGDRQRTTPATDRQPPPVTDRRTPAADSPSGGPVRFEFRASRGATGSTPGGTLGHSPVIRMRQLPPTRPSEPYWFDRYPPRYAGLASVATLAVLAAVVLLSLSPFMLAAGAFAAAVCLVAVRAEVE